MGAWLGFSPRPMPAGCTATICGNCFRRAAPRMWLNAEGGGDARADFGMDETVGCSDADWGLVILAAGAGASDAEQAGHATEARSVTATSGGAGDEQLGRTRPG